MARAEVAAGTAVIKQGDVADYFYVVERGQFQVRVRILSGFQTGKLFIYIFIAVGSYEAMGKLFDGDVFHFSQTMCLQKFQCIFFHPSLFTT